MGFMEATWRIILISERGKCACREKMLSQLVVSAAEDAVSGEAVIG
jgi:hypothetical protein